MAKNVLIVGSGGREYAMAQALEASEGVKYVMTAGPGLGNTQGLTKAVVAPGIQIGDPDTFLQHPQDLTIIGPDGPLQEGVVDALRERGQRVFGPTRAAARLETSKVFAKVLMRDIKVPTARFDICSGLAETHASIRGWHTYPLVVKFSGLAGGKGVEICQTPIQAHDAVDRLSAQCVTRPTDELFVLEEFLEGPELSVHAVCNGETYLLLPMAQDHKTLTDDPSSRMTGGMGTIASVPWVTQQQTEQIRRTIIEPVLKEMVRRGMPFTGCLFTGLKMTASGPKVLEFNVRFGDPETQAMLPLLTIDFVDLIEAAVDDRLHELPASIFQRNSHVLCVILAARGYPVAAKTGDPITEDLSGDERLIRVVHAATRRDHDGTLRTAGGRVAGIVSQPTLSLATSRRIVYDAISRGRFAFDGMQYRTDIGSEALRLSTH